MEALGFLGVGVHFFQTTISPVVNPEVYTENNTQYPK